MPFGFSSEYNAAPDVIWQKKNNYPAHLIFRITVIQRFHLGEAATMYFATPLLCAPVARYCVWDAGVSGEPAGSPPDVSFVEPLLRRRLSSMMRMTLRVAYDCAHDLPGVRFVYASRHGELARTTSMLEALSNQEALSPAVFSMSVLNASTGLFSMLEKNTAPATAISAGRATFAYGLLEACMQLKEHPEQAVLYVYADEPLPAVYGERERAGCGAHAVGLLLQSSAQTRITCAFTRTDEAPSEVVQSRSFLRCLEQGDALWSDGDQAWIWKKEG